MNRLSLCLGKPMGVPLVLHWSFVLFTFWLLFNDPSFVGLYLAVIFSVVLHEYGHCFCARQVGIEPGGITIFPIGGAANIQVPYDDPRKEFIITAGGPPVNMILSMIFLGFFMVFNTLGYTGVAEWCKTFSVIQLILVAFNCLPTYPMDGGRIFRVFATLLTGDVLKGTWIAVRLGQLVSLGVIIFFLALGNWWVPMILILMMIMAEADYHNLKEKVKKDAGSEGEKQPTPFEDIFEVVMERSPLKERAAKLDNMIEGMVDGPLKTQVTEISGVMKQVAQLDEKVI